MMKSLNTDASLVLGKDETLYPETQAFEFCETDLFPETLQNSEITSRSNCYDENFSYAANVSFPSDLDDKYSSGPIEANKLQSSPTEIVNDSATTNRSTIDTAIAAATINNNNTLSIIYDSQDDLDNTLSASIDFCTSPAYPEASYLTLSHQDQLNFSSVEPQVQVTDIALNGLSVSKYPADPLIPFMAPTLSSVYEDDWLSMMPPFLRLNPTVSSPYSFLDSFTESFLPGTLSSTLTADNSAILTKPILAGSELQSKELDYLGNDGGKFCPDQLQQIYNSRDIQSLCHDNQQLGSGDVSTHLSTEISALEDSTFKVAKLSVEQRKEKIHRYIKKRNERNFSKKIKYACRKTLADSRPRVRGRFARNDDFGDTTHRHTGGHPEEYYYDEASVKEEEDLVNPSNIFAHISGVNSFRCGYPIQSWI